MLSVFLGRRFMMASGSNNRIVEVLEITERDGEPLIIALDYSAAAKLRIPFAEFVAGISLSQSPQSQR